MTNQIKQCPAVKTLNLFWNSSDYSESFFTRLSGIITKMWSKCTVWIENSLFLLSTPDNLKPFQHEELNATQDFSVGCLWRRSLSKTSVSGKATRSVNHFIWIADSGRRASILACARKSQRTSNAWWEYFNWRLVARFLGYSFTWRREICWGTSLPVILLVDAE